MMIKTLLITLLFAFLIISCKENSNEPDDIVSTSGNFRISFNHTMNDNPINFDNELHTNEAGNNFYISKIRYFISGVQFEKLNGEFITFDSLYFLIDPANNSNSLIINDLDYDNFKSVSFNIGIDSATNHSDPTVYDSDHPLSLINHNLHWGWASGYIFFSIEGILEYQEQTQGFTYHLGLNKNLINIKFDNISHSENEDLHNITFKLDKFFSSPNLIDQTNEVSVTHSLNDNGLSDRLVENLKNSFEYNGAIKYE